jgi:hypothetical protein
VSDSDPNGVQKDGVGLAKKRVRDVSRALRNRTKPVAGAADEICDTLVVEVLVRGLEKRADEEAHGREVVIAEEDGCAGRSSALR